MNTRAHSCGRSEGSLIYGLIYRSRIQCHQTETISWRSGRTNMWKAPPGYQVLGVFDAHAEQNKPTYGGPKRVRQLVMGLGILVVGVWLTWHLILLTGWDQITPQAGYTSRTAWPDVRYLFILYIFCSETDSSGDSYTTVDYDVTGEHPNERNPIGNPEFPGHT